jgi:hypothetical protein
VGVTAGAAAGRGGRDRKYDTSTTKFVTRKKIRDGAQALYGKCPNMRMRVCFGGITGPKNSANCPKLVNEQPAQFRAIYGSLSG